MECQQTLADLSKHAWAELQSLKSSSRTHFQENMRHRGRVHVSTPNASTPPAWPDDTLFADFEAAQRVLRRLKLPLAQVAEMAQRSQVLHLRLDDYYARCAPPVRRALRWLHRDGRNWNTVSFVTFMSRSTTCFDRALSEMNRLCAQGDTVRRVLLCVDSPFKSSFWMACLLLSRAMSSPKKYGALKKMMHIMIASRHDLQQIRHAHHEHTLLVFIDDAAYSGKQMVEHVRAVRAAGSAERTMLIVPYVSSTAMAVFRRMQEELGGSLDVICEQMFQGLFQGRRPAACLQHDVFLLPVDKSGKPDKSARPLSLFFDFLQLENFHTCTIFEHKVPDAVSIPSSYLHLGPLPSPSKYAFFQVRPDARAELLAHAGAMMLKQVPGPRDVSHAVREFLAMLPIQHASPRYLSPLLLSQQIDDSHALVHPILDPGSCEMGYASRLHAIGTIISGSRNPAIVLSQLSADVPDCFQPPYKGGPFQRSVQDSLSWAARELLDSDT